MTTNIISKDRAAKVAAILYIQSHGDAVKIGDQIEYAAHESGRGWTPATFTVSDGDLKSAESVLSGALSLPAVDASRRTARILSDK